MRRTTQLYAAVRLAIACTILAVGFRTWLVMGLIEPVVVSGSSMAPAFLGSHVAPNCPECEHCFSVGAEFAVEWDAVTCPGCSKTEISLEGLKLRWGDRLWVDRFTLQRRAPRRWEAVVARNPRNAATLCVKRVVGLPGERVDLDDGDVRVDGRVLIKSIKDQRAVRQLVHRETSANRRWQPDQENRWQPHGDGWHHAGNNQSTTGWLRYRHPKNEPVTDDVPHNAGITRRLNKIDEFALALDVQIRDTGTIQFALDDGAVAATIRVSMPDGRVELIRDEQSVAVCNLAPDLARRLAGGVVSIELCNFDGQLLFLIDDDVVLRTEWVGQAAIGSGQPVAIGIQGLDATLSHLTLYRDLFHNGHPVGSAGPISRCWQLGAGEYFLLGDNAPISVDSRLWGPVPAGLIVGRPL
ncbi:MAG: S26 family signal peptidase [Planctomycetota bacterium]